MRRLRYTGRGGVLVEDVEEPWIGPEQALIRVRASALCGSERKALVRGHPSNPGHEAAGVIEALTSSDPRFRVGQLVGLAAVTGCGRCERCAAGRETQCRNGPIVGGGWHAEYAAVPVTALRLVGHDDPVNAALMSGDALGVPARVARRFPQQTDARVAVVGLGPVGLGHVLVQSFLGARVLGIEPSAERRKQALRLGAAEVHEPGDPLPAPSTVIECTGLPGAIEDALQLVDTGGTVIQSGECQQPISMVPSDIVVHREITYTGSWFYATEDYPFMNELLAHGLPLPDLCTHQVEPDEAGDAFAEFLHGRTGKVIVRW